MTTFAMCTTKRLCYTLTITAAALSRAWAEADSSTIAPSSARKLPPTFQSNPLTAFSSAAFSTRRGPSTSKSHPRRPPGVYFTGSGNYLESLSTDIEEEECIADDCLLTPRIYATSDDAEHKVEDNIADKAFAAFQTTDFEHEPHLSPELESQWLQDNEGDGEAPYFMSPKATVAELNQRALLEARIGYEVKAKAAAAKSKEMAQRSLLAARLSMESESKDATDRAENKELRSEWMESEALAASMGAYEHTVGLGAAASSAAQASGVTIEEAESYETEEESNYPASKLATTAERMILGEDIALDIALIEDGAEHESETKTNQDNTVQLVEQKKTISEVNQWRQDYVQEIRNYMQKKAVEKTKRRLARKGVSHESNAQDDNNDSESSSTPEKTGTAIASFKSENSAVKRALENGLIRRMKQRRRLIITALVMVLTRRLVLAWWGNAMRLI